MERSELLVQMLGLVHAHDEADDLFIVYPNKIGFGQLVAPISGGDEAVATKLNLLLQLSWPAGTLMQVTLYGSPDLVGITSSFAELRQNVQDPLLRSMSQSHIEFIKGGAYQPIDDKTGVRLRDTRVAITVQIPFKGAAPTEQELRAARELRVGFDQALSSAGIGGIRITPRVYIRLMETILNHGTDSAWRQSPITTYDDSELICTQVLDPGNAVEVDAEGLWLNGSARVRVLSPKRYPDFLYFGMAMRYLTDPKQGARGIRENAIVTLNVSFPDQEPTRSKMEKDQMWSTHQSSTPIARFIKYYRDRKASLDVVLNEVNTGDRIVEAYIAMAIITHGEGTDAESRALTEERSVAATINAQAYWREFGFQMMQDRNIVLPFFSQLLPFAADDGLKKVMERYKRMAGKHATYLMPVFGQWRGTGTPLFTLIARDGQVQPISPWDTDGNMNFMCCAASGSGKSVFCQAVISNMRTIGGRAWIIDVGDSYKNLCEMMEGEYINFDGSRHICINPFTLVRDFQDEVDMLATLVGVMIAPNEGLDDFRLPMLKRAMQEVWDMKAQRMTIDDLAAHLLAHERKEVSDMGEQLYSFTSQGSYGKYFAGDNNIDVTNPLTVLELGALKAKEHLQRVVLLSLMYQISQAVYMGDRSTKSMLLVDEAWQLLASDETASFIERAYRQFRKHSASVGVITQSVMDVWETKGGRAIAENSAHLYLLKQKSDSIDAVQREKRLPFGDWGYEMLKTVHTVEKQYSEIMCVTPKGTGIGRLYLTPFQKVMFSTSGDDVSALKRLRERGMSLKEAITAVVQERTQAMVPFKRDKKRAA